MDSDGAGHRKRKRSRDYGDQGLRRNDHEQDEEEEDVSEEEKMKAFFDLIQAARGARERLFGRTTVDGDNNKPRRQPAVWIPTFQASDFVDDPGKDIAKVPAEASDGPSRPEANPGKGEEKEERGGEGHDGGVNLKLSL
ncbi:hypothetical protein MLD38_020709 [Melastoma candidum]|uniref:Uncharacterized protein n=1 Tax=Melastoma candidum TaxID=119954 RepID=A0ACB9QDB6_9MYRT|nr:hypothetical protein MLD38_020709 [Melastoma candidum]